MTAAAAPDGPAAALHLRRTATRISSQPTSARNPEPYGGSFSLDVIICDTN